MTRATTSLNSSRQRCDEGCAQTRARTRVVQEGTGSLAFPVNASAWLHSARVQGEGIQRAAPFASVSVCVCAMVMPCRCAQCTPAHVLATVFPILLPSMPPALVLSPSTSFCTLCVCSCVWSTSLCGGLPVCVCRCRWPAPTPTLPPSSPSIQRWASERRNEHLEDRAFTQAENMHGGGTGNTKERTHRCGVSCLSFQVYAGGKRSRAVEGQESSQHQEREKRGRGVE